jgi:hypothetical protein
MIPTVILMQAPFRLTSEMSANDAGIAIAQSIEYFSSLANPLSTAFAIAMQVAEVSIDDPLHMAGAALAHDIDAGIGAGNGNAYHNKIHFLEVLLCITAIAAIADMSAHEKALLYVAAIAHDFHHDGQPNLQPYRLELSAVKNMQTYLEQNMVSKSDMQALAALVLSTETHTGVAYARACYRRHYRNDLVISSLPVDGKLTLLESNRRLSLMAVALAEADIIPSIGLTVQLAKVTAARLEQEWGKPMGSQSKIEFIDDFASDLQVAAYFMPNVQAIRRAFSDR